MYGCSGLEADQQRSVHGAVGADSQLGASEPDAVAAEISFENCSLCSQDAMSARIYAHSNGSCVRSGCMCSKRRSKQDHQKHCKETCFP
jgi:hypothetical protein